MEQSFRLEGDKHIISSDNKSFVDIRFARPEDNTELIDIFKRYPPNSSLSYVVDRSPDYFQLCKLQGYDWRVIVAAKEKVLGSILISFDKVYLDKKIENIAYTCDLRLDNSARGTGIADRLMREGIYSCRENDRNNNPKVFTCILSDNQAGIKKNLNLGRDNIINMKKVGDIKSYFLLPFSPKKVNDKGYQIRQANLSDLPEMYNLWNKINSLKNLARAFSFEDFKSWITNSPGLKIENYLLAIKENKIVGYFGIWNQSVFRRVIISSEAFSMKFIRWLWNIFKPFTKMQSFPKPGQSLNFYNVVNLCIDEIHADSLTVLINSAFKIVRENKSLFLAIALDKKDILNQQLKPFFSSTTELVMLSNYELENKNKFFHVEIGLG